MTIPSNFQEVLTFLYQRLKAADFPWAFTGSVGMVLQGMDLEVHDIDLQTDEPGSPAIQAMFAEFVTRPVALRQSTNIQSWFGALEINGIEVEIMGDMTHRDPTSRDGKWLPPFDLAALIRWVEYQGMHLPVMDLEHEYEAYLQMGRDEKARQIRAFLDSRRQS